MNFKFVISHKQKSYQVEKDQKDSPIIGKKIGETIDGEFLGLAGYELLVTGGSDKEGFPMRKDIETFARKKLILTNGSGYHTSINGKRKRKTLRGNTVSLDVVQVNCKVLKEGSVPIEQVLGKTEKKTE